MPSLITDRRNRGFWIVITLVVLLSAAAALAATLAAKPWRYGGNTIYGQSFLVGSTTESLVRGQGLLTCTESMGTPGNPICYRAARMPVASGTLALEVLLLGDHPRPIVILKNLLYMIPYWLACGLVLWQARAHPRHMLISAVLLFLPMLILNYTGSIVNVDTEEGYLFGVLGLSIALVVTARRTSAGWIVAVAATLDFLYLCKSSMLPVCAVLACSALLRLRTPVQRVAIVLLLCMAPAGWAVWQHHTSGRFSLGTSLDGLNFEKGNNPRFLDRYPGESGVLDQFDSELSQGMHFQDEWAFNAYHLQQGKRFALSHPGYTLHSIGRKAVFMLVTFNRHARTKMGLAGTLIVESGFVLFRLLLWVSLALALYAVFARRSPGRFAGITYVCFVAAYVAPYVAGFGYMRHAVMLAFPAVIFLALAGMRWNQPEEHLLTSA